jgi:hypothetical protein
MHIVDSGYVGSIIHCGGPFTVTGITTVSAVPHVQCALLLLELTQVCGLCSAAVANDQKLRSSHGRLCDRHDPGCA